MYYTYLAFLSSNSGRDFINDTSSAQTVFRDRLDYQWHTYLGGTNSHPIWTIMVNFSLFIALGVFIFYAYTTLIEFNEKPFKFSDLKKFILPTLIGILLANNGQLTAQMILGLRDLGQGLNYNIAETYGVYNQVSTDFAKANNVLSNSQVRSEVSIAQDSCKDLQRDLNRYEECMIEILEARQTAAQNNGNPGLFGSIRNLVTGVRNNLIDLTTYTLSSAALAGDRIRLYASAVAFNVAADIALFYAALYSPVAVATSLIPSATNSIIGWLSMVYTIIFTQISYTIMISLMADMLNQGRGLESFIFAFLVGKFIPTLAVAFGVGGGYVLFSSLSAMGIGTAGKISSLKLLGKLKPR